MQKKLALASNLFHTPEILFLDEPTTGVDPISRKELWNLLFQLNKEGTTLIVTTPYMDEAQRCSRVGLMSEGRILALKEPRSFIHDMEGDVVEVNPAVPEAKQPLEKLTGLESIYPYGGNYHLVFKKGKGDPDAVRKLLESKNLKDSEVKKISPSFEDVFLELIGKQHYHKRKNHAPE
jgi:ABC-2 type transport system ATP-binding protein